MSYQTIDESLLGTALAGRFQGAHALRSGTNAPLSRMRPFQYYYQEGPGCGACTTANRTDVAPVTPRVHASASQTGNGGAYKTLDSYCAQSDGYRACPNSIRYD